MKMGFWKKLKKPFFVLAPMHDVTDTAFRQMIVDIENIDGSMFNPEKPKKRYSGRPDVLFTEFVSIDGLLHSYSRDKMIDRYLRFDEIERPLVAQIWGRDPDKFKHAAEIIAELGFDGIDINMGCPTKHAVKAKTCSYLINEPQLAQKIIKKTKEGAGHLPVSVKTRLGYDKDVSLEWIKYLLDTEPAVITIHARIAKHMSKYPANWGKIGAIVRLRDQMKSQTYIIGNGDVKSLEDGREKAHIYKVDGVMIGRGVFSNHWLFTGRNPEDITVEERLEAIIRHAYLYEKNFQDRRNFCVMRKNFKAYLKFVKNSKSLKMNLMQARSANEVESMVRVWYNNYTTKE